MARQNNSGKKAKKAAKKKAPKMSEMRAKIKAAKKPQLKKAKIMAPVVKKSAKAAKKNQYTLQKTFLSSATVRSYLIGAAGENTITVLREFTAELSDEELAKKAKMKVSDVRIVLNKLHSLGMAQYARSRDKDSGWYSYVWRIDEEKEKEILAPIYKNNNQQEYGGEMCVESEGDKYFCNGCGDCSIVDFGTAMDRQFKCANCGCDLSFFEKKKSV